MLLLFFVLYLPYLRSSASPLPLVAENIPQSPVPGQSFIPPPFKYGTRSSIEILWSCLATIFACAWVAVHPNVPPKGSKYQERIKCLLVSLFAPEFMVLWAIAQWYGARKILKELNFDGNPEVRWTLTHANFLQMGALVLYENSQATKVLDSSLLSLHQHKDILSKIKITKEEILDRSKNNTFDKAVAILQTTWFVVQCVGRWADGLFVTELELVTLAFAVLNGFMYYFWWDKPFNVDVPLAVHVFDEFVVLGSLTKISKSHSFLVDRKNRELPPLPNSDSFILRLWKAFLSALNTVISQLYNFPEFINEMRVLLRMNSNFATFLQSVGRCYDSFFNLGIQHDPLAVQTFDASVIQDDHHIGFTAFSGFAFIFGGIHCIGWILHFLTSAEVIIWRISSVIISAFSFCILLFWLFRLYLPENRLGNAFPARLQRILRGLTGMGTVLYIFARVILSVEPFIALRHLPPEALATLKWTSFFPMFS